MNQVDTSLEKVEAEWRKIEDEFKLIPAELNEEGEFVPAGEASEAEKKSEEYKLSPEEYEVKVAATKGLINGGLKMAFFMLKVDEIPEYITDEFCVSWAKVIVSRFPENPVTDFMDEYGDLISAGGATLVLIGAVRTSKTKAQIAGQIKSGMQKAQEESGGVENGH